MALKLSTGFDGVQAALDKQSSGGSRDYVPKILWKDNGKDDIHILRFLPDLGGETIPVTLKLYSFVTCDDDTIRDFVVPMSVGLDEPDWFVENGIQLQDFTKNWVPATETERTVSIALAAYREEKKVNVDGRSRLVVEDMIENRTWTDKDGNEKSSEGAKIGLVSQAVGNFWDNFKQMAARNGGLTDRDYEIKRSGQGKKVKFPPSPLDPIDGLRTEQEVLDHYKDLIPFKLEDWILARVATKEVCEELLSKGRGKGSGKSKEEREVEKNRDGSSQRTETRSYDKDDEPRGRRSEPEEEKAEPSSGRMSNLRDTLTG